MSKQTSPETPASMYPVLEEAFKAQERISAKLADESIVWDKSTKALTRREVNRLKGMMEQVLSFKEELVEEMIDGMTEVIVNAEAKLDGKPMKFKADITEDHLDLAA